MGFTSSSSIIYFSSFAALNLTDDKYIDSPLIDSTDRSQKQSSTRKRTERSYSFSGHHVDTIPPKKHHPVNLEPVQKIEKLPDIWLGLPHPPAWDWNHLKITYHYEPSPPRENSPNCSSRISSPQTPSSPPETTLSSSSSLLNLRSEPSPQHENSPNCSSRIASPQTPSSHPEITLSSSSSLLNPRKTPLSRDLVIKYLQSQNFSAAIINEVIAENTFTALIETCLKQQTTYIDARKIEKERSFEKEDKLSKTDLQRIFIEASMHLHATRDSPKVFFHQTPRLINLFYIAYRNLAGLISLYEWSGFSSVKDVPKENFLDAGSSSIAQITKEISTGKLDVLKSLRTDMEHYKTRYYARVHNIVFEIDLLQKIETQFGKLLSIIEPPKVILPPQIILSIKNLFSGAYIQERYDGNLLNFNFYGLTGKQKQSFLLEFMKIIKAVRYLNTELDFDGSPVLHSDIKNENILYKKSSDGFFTLRLIDFGNAVRYDEAISGWYPQSDKENWLPIMYSQGYFLTSDKKLLARLAKERKLEEIKTLCRAMEMYALGKTIQNTLLGLYGSTKDNLIKKANEDEFYPNFYIDLMCLCTQMCHPDPYKRIVFEQAELALLQLVG
jgi:hypothetical protein